MHAFLTKDVLDNLTVCLRLPAIATSNACNLDPKYCTVFVSYRLTLLFATYKPTPPPHVPHYFGAHWNCGAIFEVLFFNSLYLFICKLYGKTQKSQINNACAQCEPETIMVIASLSNTNE